MYNLIRILKFVFPALIALAVVSGWGLSWVFKNSLPDSEGHVAMSGLSAPVHIYQDKHGVPHIFAADMKSAVHALGYVHASERMFQMEMQRRAGQGRLSEAVGLDMLAVDKFTRTLGLYHLAESSFLAMSPEAQSFFQAYAEGVNVWLRTHKNKLPPEFLLLGVTPEPWKPTDSIVWGKLMGLQLSHNYKLEQLRAELSSKLTPQQMSIIFPQASGAMPVTIAPHTLQKSENSKTQTEGALDQLGKITTLDHGASNEWVISGSRTESGKPILANDPHLGLEAPILWYLARIVTPNFSIKGASVPGLPIILLGQNDHIAWGLTTTGSDVQDLFIETLDPKNSEYYLTPNGKSEAFIERDEVIHVKHGLDVTLKVRSTRHGPVMSDIDDEMASLAGKGKVMALAFTGLGDKDLTSEALMQLNRATDWKSFLDALKIYQTPPQNMVFADTAGNIGFINPGLVPVRKNSNGVMPVDGASGAYDWVGTIPFTQLPQLYNPRAGFIFNANNSLAGPGSLYFLGVDWEEPYRSERLQQFFDTLAKHSLETSAMMQADHVSMAVKELLPMMLEVKTDDKRSHQALALLKSWDGTMDKTRAEPLIFEAWLYQLRQTMMVAKTGNSLKERGPYMATSINAILSNHASEWCGEALDKPAPNCNQALATALEKALDMLEKRERGVMSSWRWGDEHITMLKHKVYSHLPYFAGKSDLSISSDGDYYTLDRGGSFTFDPDHPFARTHGGGYRGLYDLGDPSKSRFMITTGQSGNITSPHYGDLVPLWNDVKSFTLTGTEEELKVQGLPDLVLEPAP